MDFNTSVRLLRGIGESKSALFGKLGIKTSGDLIELFPRRYENRGDIKKLFDCADGEIASALVKVETTPSEKYGKNGMSYVKVLMSDETAVIYITFFNNKWIKNSISPGQRFRLYGRITYGQNGRESVNPVLEPVLPDRKLRDIIPVYPLTKGLAQRDISSAVEQVMPLCELMGEIFPGSFMLEHGLIGRSQAYRNIHKPENTDELAAAVKRLAFEELVIFQLSLRMMKQGNDTKRALPVTLKGTGARLFFESFPYKLTGAQERVIKDIVSDISLDRPMTRLVQGDVGSGKTAVAAAAIYIAVKNGYQAAMMAPTEILAAQHYNTLSKFFDSFDIKTELLVGNVTAAGKKKIRQGLENGDIDVLVGTNAIIQGGVEFKNLLLAVTDEQHRFGVMQRASLVGKGGADQGLTPHTLVMSATPIPRTLSLILYGDLDVSIIDELPPGRKIIKTTACSDELRERVYSFIGKRLAEGSQVYVVCPLVEENETLPRKAAEEHEKTLKAVFPDYNIGLLHGKMTPKKKNEVMQAFKNNEINILISTTVIEVGVDVPNATVMVVENAECFGLSTLHQLRGRVGRGEKESYCILMYDRATPRAKERLEAMCSTNDGFIIAEMDLKLRGPGDFFGERQSGEIQFRVANIADMHLVEQTKSAVDNILKNNLLKTPEYKELYLLASRLYKTNKEKNTLN